MKQLVTNIANGLTSLSASLASIGKIVAGPNLMNATDSLGRTVTRLGIWIEDAGFPVLPPAPPTQPLPILSVPAATAGFATVPVQLAPDLDASGLPTNLPGPSFALLIPVATLQHMLDAVTPTAQAAAAQNSVTINSITAQTNAPGSVSTIFTGDLPLGIGLSFTITEVLGLVALAGTNPPQMIPAVIGNSHSTGVGNLLDWFIGVVVPLFGIALTAAFGIVSSAVGKISGQVNGIAAPLIAGIPSRFPFSNTSIPPIPFPVPEFPTLIPNWKTFGADPDGIVGTATSIIAPRDQSMVSMSLSGSGFIAGYAEDLAGGAGQTYGCTLVNISPDTGKFTWQTSGNTGTRGGAIAAGAFGQGGSFGADFALPLRPLPANYPFTLAANGTESCGTDPSKILTASTSVTVHIDVKPNPKLPP